MQLLLLFLLAAMFPALWGWFTWWWLGRLWPASRENVGQHVATSHTPVDYQI